MNETEWCHLKQLMVPEDWAGTKGNSFTSRVVNTHFTLQQLTLHSSEQRSCKGSSGGAERLRCLRVSVTFMRPLHCVSTLSLSQHEAFHRHPVLVDLLSYWWRRRRCERRIRISLRVLLVTYALEHAGFLNKRDVFNNKAKGPYQIWLPAHKHLHTAKCVQSNSMCSYL